MELSVSLSAPIQPAWNRDYRRRNATDYEDGGAFPEAYEAQCPIDLSFKTTAQVCAQSTLHLYGQRSSWVPPNVTDYENEGIHVAQCPLDLNRNTTAAVSAQNIAPLNGQRRDVIYYGDGGAFPEIQCPLDLSCKNDSNSNALAVQLRADVKVKHDVVARKRHAKGYTVPLYTRLSAGRRRFQKLKRKIAEALFTADRKSRLAKIRARLQKKLAQKTHEENLRQLAQIGYTVPLDDRLAADKRRLQQLHSKEKCPILAEALCVVNRKAREAVEIRAQLEKNLSQMEKEQKEKHLRQLAQEGYTVPLYKRLTTDRRRLQPLRINNNFPNLPEALYIVNRNAREAVETRVQEDLQQLAQEVRDERADIKVIGGLGHSELSDGEEHEREMLRQDRHKETSRDRNLDRAMPVIQANRSDSDKEFCVIDRSGAGPSGTVRFKKAEDLFDLNQFMSKL